MLGLVGFRGEMESMGGGDSNGSPFVYTLFFCFNSCHFDIASLYIHCSSLYSQQPDLNYSPPSIVITARAFGIHSFLGLAAVQNLFYVNFATNLGADLYVALVLSYFLWTSRTGFNRSESFCV